MNTLSRAGLVLSFTALLPFTSVLGQSQLSVERPALIGGVVTDPALIAARWEQAEQLRFEGKFAEALTELEAIAQLQTEDFENAARTYWVIAEIHNALGDQLEMARSLDRGIDHAGRFGDQELRARALLESASAYARLRDHGTASRRIGELQRLLDSETLSQELRDYIDRRIEG